MKKLLIPISIVVLIVILAFGGILLLLSGGIYNKGVDLRADAETAWSNVESSYQRRNDLTGNLVKIVQGAADFEQETLTQVIEARAKATSTTVNVDDLSPERLAQFQEAQSGLTSALSRLLVTVERYPELQATAAFRDFQSQYEGTENRINVARDRYNESVNAYDKHIKRFPNFLLAGYFGFDEMPRYQAQAGSENAPEINFD